METLVIVLWIMMGLGLGISITSTYFGRKYTALMKQSDKNHNECMSIIEDFRIENESLRKRLKLKEDLINFINDSVLKLPKPKSDG